MSETNDSQRLVAVTEGLAATRTAVEQLSSVLTSHDQKLDRLREEMSVLKTQHIATREIVQRLDTALHHGNGVPSIQTRLIMIEETVTGVKASVGALRKDEKDLKKQQLQTLGSVIAAAIAAIAAVAAAFLKK